MAISSIWYSCWLWKMILQREGCQVAACKTSDSCHREWAFSTTSCGDNYMELKTAVLSQQLSTQRRIEEVKGELLCDLTGVSLNNFSCQLRNIHSAVKRIVVQAVFFTVWALSRREVTVMVAAIIQVQLKNRSVAELYPRPQNLYDLWQEYKLGLSTNKAANKLHE